KKYPSIYKEPNVSVFDYNENLALSLDRESIDTNELPFQEELVIEIYKDFLAYALTSSLESFPSIITEEALDFYNHPAVFDRTRYSHKGFLKNINRIVFTNRGYTFLNSSCLKANKIDTIVEIWVQQYNVPINTAPDNVGFVFHLDTSSSIDTFKSFLHRYSTAEVNLEAEDNSDYYHYPYDYTYDKLYAQALCTTRRITLLNKDYQYYFDPNLKRLPSMLKNLCNIDEVHGNWITLLFQDYAVGLDNEGPILNYKYITNDNIDPKIKVIVTNFISQYLKSNKEEDVIFDDLLQRYLGNDKMIPYSKSERKTKYASAFNELKSFIDNYTYQEIS
ncbi:MAG TPA: hypothetical protein VIG72_13475, partial [Pontibacter sp.]